MHKYWLFGFPNDMRTFLKPYNAAADAIGTASPAQQSAFSGPLADKPYSGNRISDIKRLREQTGLGLKQAKDIVDKIYEEKENARFRILDVKIVELFESAGLWGFTMKDALDRFNKVYDERKPAC